MASVPLSAPFFSVSSSSSRCLCVFCFLCILWGRLSTPFVPRGSTCPGRKLPRLCWLGRCAFAVSAVWGISSPRLRCTPTVLRFGSGVGLVVLVWCGLGLGLVWWWLDLLSWVLGRGFFSVNEGVVMGWSSGECQDFVLCIGGSGGGGGGGGCWQWCW